MFIVGISRHERGLEPVKACREDNAADGLFCEEGYFFSFYSHFLLEATWKQKDPKHPVPIEIADADAPIKVMALGMAAVQKSIPPSGIRLRDNRYEKYFYDGYGAGRQLALGRAERNVDDICAGMRYRIYCEFGAGRAGYFLDIPPGKAKDHPEYQLGQEFASVVTGDVVPADPTRIQELALAWRKHGNVGEAGKVYLCAIKKGSHMIDCLAPASGRRRSGNGPRRSE